MTDDLTLLDTSEHWLAWLGDDPQQVLRSEIESILREQVPSACLDWIRLREKPHYLTSGRRMLDDPEKLVVTRAALAVSFELQVRLTDRVDLLRGAFSWVATGLDGTRRDKVHLDFDVEFAWAIEQLANRMYETEGRS